MVVVFVLLLDNAYTNTKPLNTSICYQVGCRKFNIVLKHCIIYFPAHVTNRKILWKIAQKIGVKHWK